MKKISKKLALRTETIRVLDAHALGQVVGGSVLTTVTSIIQSSGTSVISVSTATTVQSSGTSVISRP